MFTHEMVRFHFSSASCTTENPHFYSAQLDKKHERGKATTFFLSFTLALSKDQIPQSTQNEYHFFFSSCCSIKANVATCRAGLFKERKGISVALHDHKSINKILKNEESSFVRVGRDQTQQRCYNSSRPMQRAN